MLPPTSHWDAAFCWRWLGIAVLGHTLVTTGLFVFTIPPWQGPDEPGHFEYVEAFYSRQGFRAGERDPASTQRIIDSMDANRFWALTDTEPHVFPSQLKRVPPLYYALVAILIGAPETGDSITTRLYQARLVSAALGLSVLVATWIVARAFAPEDYPFAVTTVSFVALLPQRVYVSATVNSDNLTNAISGLLMVLLLAGATGKLGGLRLWSALTATMIVGMFTKRTVLFFLPAIAILATMALVRNRRRAAAASHLGPIARGVFATGLAACGLYLITATLALYWPQLFLRATDGIAPVLQMAASAMTAKGQGTPIDLVTSFGVMFVSFWLSFGYMVQKLSIGWNVMLGSLVALAAVGLLIALGRCLRTGAGPRGGLWTWAITASVPATALVAEYALHFGSLPRILAQGRYLYPGLPAIAILLVTGLGSLNDARRGQAWSALVIVMLALNMLGFERYLLGLFYGGQ
ncbi:MAG: DUF2142 domain-containing protein [Candidatus Schekmanbacteria bacterium]|nr:DUF2142 domain-containing protein [Candidatus Schekmanbacteria bacterium]